MNRTISVNVLYFAVLRERLARDGETLQLPPDADVGAARAALASLHPELAPLLPRVATAVNRTMAPDSQQLSDGDELAFIPPVAGGRANGL